MPILKDLIERMDRFVGEIVNSHDVTYEEKKRQLGELLREASQTYSSIPLQPRRLLGERITRLRKIQAEWQRMHPPSELEELTRFSKELKILVHLAGARPTPDKQAQIDELRERIAQLKASLPRPIRPLGVGEGVAPPQLQEAVGFRKAMEGKILADEASLRDAIAKTKAKITELDAFRSALTPGAHAIWGRQAFDEISTLGRLIQRWNRQIAYLKLQESKARAWGWEQDKAQEEKRVYVTAKEVAKVKGEEQVDALKTLREVQKEIERAFSLAEMIVSKALVQLMPEAIPMDKVATIVGKSQAILDGVRDRVPEADVRETTRKIDALRRYEAEMNRILGKLGYDKRVESYEEGKKSEGLSYFRANLPAEVRDILPARDVSGLEDLASKGLSGAREAISKAIILAAKRNPERIKALLER